MAEPNVLTSPGGKTALVGIMHGKPLQLRGAALAEVKQIGAREGYYYEGNGADRAAAEKVIPNITWVGSWDDLITSPDRPSDFYYTLFSNSAAGTKAITAKLIGPGSIKDALVKHANDIAHEAIKGETGRASIAQFLTDCGAGLLNDAKQTATREHIAAFIAKGGREMWPDNWQDFPNPAGKVAERAEKFRLKAVVGRAGVYFMGSDNLPLARQINPRLAPVL